MITHVVLLRFLPGVDATTETVQQMHRVLQALPAQISEIRAWQCGFNLTADAQAADYVLLAGFDDEAALYRYFAHPAHLAVMPLIETVGTLQFADI